MAGSIARCGVDSAGGVINPPSTPRTVLINGAPVAVVGDSVMGHGSGPHVSALLAVQSPRTVLVNGSPVITTGDLASCAHPVVASSNVLVTTS